MKHLKTYENLLGDNDFIRIKRLEDLSSFVLVRTKGMIRDQLDLPDGDFLPGQITSIASVYPVIKFSNGVEILFDVSDIQRDLTDEEIDKFKLQLDANKYNI